MAKLTYSRGRFLCCSLCGLRLYNGRACNCSKYPINYAFKLGQAVNTPLGLGFIVGKEAAPIARYNVKVGDRWHLFNESQLSVID